MSKIKEQQTKIERYPERFKPETKEKINDAKSAVHDFFHREDKTKEQNK